MLKMPRRLCRLPLYDRVTAVGHDHRAVNEGGLFVHEKTDHVRNLLRLPEPLQRLQREKALKPAPLVAGIARSVMKSRRIDRSRRDGVHPDAVRLQCNRGGTRH